SPRARDHWTVRIHRHGSRLDCHRSRASAVGGAGDHPHTRCGDADARSRRPDDAVRTALPHARRDRRRIDRANGARHHMREFFSSIGLPETVAAALVLALNAYVLMAGADFGGGVWDLIASGPRREAQRALIAESIGPIWEANHVWLIVVVVVLFTAFPDGFGGLGAVLHIPTTIMLVGIVLRGSAFMFRSYGSRSHHGRHHWGRAFASASVVTPVLLGVIVGAISSGAVGRAASSPMSGSFMDVYVR